MGEEFFVGWWLVVVVGVVVVGGEGGDGVNVGGGKVHDNHAFIY